MNNFNIYFFSGIFISLGEIIVDDAANQQNHHENEVNNSFIISHNSQNSHGDEDVIIRNPLDRGPYIDKTASKNVTTLVGHTVYLNCRVRNLGNKTVTWIRHKDLHLLTIGKLTYTPDQRYQSVHNPQQDDWSLKVLYPQRSDSGVYECQVSTTPPISYSMILNVVGKKNKKIFFRGSQKKLLIPEEKHQLIYSVLYS